MELLQKIMEICGNISLVIAPGADIFIAYIVLNLTQSPHFSVSSIQGILQILQVVPSFSSWLFSSLDNAVKLWHCRDGPGYCPFWCISSMYFFIYNRLIVPSFLLLFSPQLFQSYFAVPECALLWDIRVFLGNWSREFPQNFFTILWVMDTVKRITVKMKSKCSRNYSRLQKMGGGTMIRLLKLEKNSINFYVCCYKKVKKRLVCVVC